MTVKDTSPPRETQSKAVSERAEEATEAVHLAGSAVVTGAVAVLLTVIAIPVTLGLGVVLGAKALVRRVRGG